MWRAQLLVGIFWPSMMKLRSQYVPEDIRATILNLFRVPLNLFVCLILYNVRQLTPLFCTCLPPVPPATMPCMVCLLQQCRCPHLQVASLPLSVMFGTCSLFLGAACLCQHQFLLLSVRSRVQHTLKRGLSNGPAHHLGR